MEYVIERETLSDEKSYFRACCDLGRGDIWLNFTSLSSAKRFSDIEEAKSTIQKLLEFEKMAQKMFSIKIRTATYRIIAIRSEIVKFETEAVFSVENSVSDTIEDAENSVLDVIQEEFETDLESETALQTELETLNEDCAMTEQEYTEDPELRAIREYLEEDSAEDTRCTEDSSRTDNTATNQYIRKIEDYMFAPEQQQDLEIETAEPELCASDDTEYTSEKQQYQRVAAVDVAYSERLKENLQEKIQDNLQDKLQEDLQQPAEELCEDAYKAYQQRKAEQDFESGRTFEYKPPKPKITSATAAKKTIFKVTCIVIALYIAFLGFSRNASSNYIQHKVPHEAADKIETYQTQDTAETYRALPEKTFQPIENQNDVLRNKK